MIAIRCTRTSSVVTASMLALACVVAARCTWPAAHSGAPQTATRNHYGAIIDAGSSGSRIAIFEWRIAGNGDPHVWPVVSMADGDLPGRRRDPKAQEEGRKAKGCPVTDLRTETDRVCGCLHALTSDAHDKARDVLAEPTLPPIALWLKATAGIRYETEATRDAVLEAATRCLGRPAHDGAGSRFTWREASVITGEEEGMYAWLAVNHVAGTLRRDPGSTFGIVEIGGRSAQLAFRVGDSASPAGAQGKTLSVPLASGTLHVYAMSQALGQTAALGSLRAAGDDKACAPGGNTASCLTGIRRFLCSDTPRGACEARKPDLAPPAGMRFVGLSTLAYATRNLGLDTLPLDTVRDRAREVCDASYDQGLRDKFLRPARDFKTDACFSALYVTEVAAVAWGLPLEQVAPPRLEWADPSWPLGAMMIEALASTTSRR